MKLMSMTDFVLEQLNEQNSRVKPIRDVLNSLENYATFLKMPLKLEMFINTNERDILFKGFEIYGNGDLYNEFVTFDSNRLDIMNVENLITDFQYSFYLTEYAVERVFGKAE